jgi:hypothetical protein
VGPPLQNQQGGAAAFVRLSATIKAGPARFLPIAYLRTAPPSKPNSTAGQARIVPNFLSRLRPKQLFDSHQRRGVFHAQSSSVQCSFSFPARRSLRRAERDARPAAAEPACSQITQRIGVTDITINYHRPLVNGRPIWGKLVPYGEVWRAGANENTTITFSDPVTVEGQALDKGTYGLHMIPGENQWTVIFSKMSTAWGSFSYKQDEDALRVTVKPQAVDLHNALAYDFDDLQPDSTVVTMRWEKSRRPLQSCGQRERHRQSQHVRKQMRGLNQYYWESWDDAAAYFLAAKTNLDEALKDEDQSIQNGRALRQPDEQIAHSGGYGPQEDANSTSAIKALG